MNQQPAISALRYHLFKLQSKKDEATLYRNQYRPASRQYQSYFEKIEKLDLEINEISDQLAGLTDKS